MMSGAPAYNLLQSGVSACHQDPATDSHVAFTGSHRPRFCKGSQNVINERTPSSRPSDFKVRTPKICQSSSICTLLPIYWSLAEEIVSDDDGCFNMALDEPWLEHTYPP